MEGSLLVLCWMVEPAVEDARIWHGQRKQNCRSEHINNVLEEALLKALYDV